MAVNKNYKKLAYNNNIDCGKIQYLNMQIGLKNCCKVLKNW